MNKTVLNPGRSLLVSPNRRFAILLLFAAALSAAALAWARQEAAANQTSCQSNLKQFALGLLMYTQDYDEMYPPMKFTKQLHNVVRPYIKNDAVFSCPETGAEYLPNPALNYLHLAAIESPATMMMLRDAKPHPAAEAGSNLPSVPWWNAAYADGHVNQVTQEPKLGKLNPSPQPGVPHKRTLAEVRAQIRALKASLAMADQQMKRLVAEERKLRRQGGR